MENPKFEKFDIIVTQEQIDKAINEAQNSFWDVIAENFPQITTGDFPPDAHIKFYNDCESAVKVWIFGNEPNFKFENDKLEIVDLDFQDQTDLNHGKYSFSFSTIDKHGSSAFDYDGHIIIQPKNSRRDDDLEWGVNTPLDWERVEPYLIDKLYQFINLNK